MAATKKIPFSAMRCIHAKNPRGFNKDHADALSRDIENDPNGMFMPVIVHPFVEATDEGAVELYEIVAGFHRFDALEMFQTRNPEGFLKKFPGGKIDCVVVEGDDERLHDVGTIENAAHMGLQPWDYQREVMRRIRRGQDQYEIATILHIAQPRVAEYVAIDSLVQDLKDAWKDGILATHDLVKFTALSEEDQYAELAKFTGAIKALPADASEKDKKKAKGAARKQLEKAAKEKGTKRAYANAGKPTRAKLLSYIPTIAQRALETVELDPAMSAFYNGLAAGLKIVNGEVNFDKVDATKTYVTKKDAAEAVKLAKAAEEKAEAQAAKINAHAAREAAKKAAKGAKAPAGAKKAAKAEKAPKKAKAAKPAKAPKKAKAAKAPKKPKTSPGTVQASSKVKQGPKSAKKAAKKAA